MGLLAYLPITHSCFEYIKLIQNLRLVLLEAKVDAAVI
jgi:hypothetical protein